MAETEEEIVVYTYCGRSRPALKPGYEFPPTMTCVACIRNAANNGPVPIAALLELCSLRRVIDTNEPLSILVPLGTSSNKLSQAFDQKLVSSGPFQA